MVWREVFERFLKHNGAQQIAKMEQVVAGQTRGNDLFAGEFYRRCSEICIFDTWERSVIRKDC